MPADRSRWPLMVRLGLSGIPNRGAAWGFCALSVAAALACIAYGFINRWFFAGALLLLAALWYALAIRWVDRHGQW